MLRTITLCSLLILQLLPVVSAESRLTAFQANYKFYYGKLKVANAQIKLSRSGATWHWRLTTNPTGLLSLLTRKEPYSETFFSRVDGSHKIQSITIADDGEGDKQLETARFDWNSKQVKMLRKGKHNMQPLSGDVYDFLTIHLLSAKMQEQGLKHASADFFYKGRLVKTALKRVENTRLEINKAEIDVTVFEHSIEGSSTRTTYYYKPDAHYLPMKIKTVKPGKTSTTMLFQSISQ
jgi:hypothetical protein